MTRGVLTEPERSHDTPASHYRGKTFEIVYGRDAFSRLDEDDSAFYATARMVEHLDATALATVERLIGGLVREPTPSVLDLMASWDSHVPPYVSPRELVGLGLNSRELEHNLALTERVIHDINRDPRLPFASERFDVVLNTVSVDYVTRPLEVFAEVARVLRPGGLFLVVFSNRMFDRKAVRVWRQADEEERVLIVEDYFAYAGGFESPEIFVSKGLPRPGDDKYAHLGLPSDPVYAVYAERSGGPVDRPRRSAPTVSTGARLQGDELRRREAMVARTLTCPHCGEKLSKWRVPQGPFTEWSAEHLYICFNDGCPYLVRGWSVMTRQGNRGFSYRFMFNPDSGAVGPVPVPTLRALRENIVEE